MSSDEGTDSQTVLMAAVWGFVSAASLLVGSIWGVYRLPKQSIRAAMMAFGGGSLLFALSIELFGHVLHEAHVRNNDKLTYTMIGTALFGGLFFAWLNRVLNNHGADIRHNATRKPQVNKLRKILSRRLLKGLQGLALFRGVTHGELQHFIIRRLQKRRVGKGHRFFGPDSDSPIINHQAGNLYMVLKGHVTLERKPLLADYLPSDKQKPWTTKLNRYGCFSEFALLMPENEVHHKDRKQCGAVVSATADKDSIILVLPEEELFLLMKEEGELHEDLLPLMQGWFVKTLLDIPDMFEKVPVESWETDLFPLLHLQEYSAGSEVLKEATSSSPLLFVLFGCLEFQCTESGKRKEARASSLVGIEHLRTGHTTPLNAVATEFTFVLQLERGADLDKHLVKLSTTHQQSDPKALKPRSTPGIKEPVLKVADVNGDDEAEEVLALPGMVQDEEEGKTSNGQQKMHQKIDREERASKSGNIDAAGIMSMPVGDIAKQGNQVRASGVRASIAGIGQGKRWSHVRHSFVQDIAKRRSVDLDAAKAMLARAHTAEGKPSGHHGNSGWDLLITDRLLKAKERERERTGIQFEDQAEVLPFFVEDEELDVRRGDSKLSVVPIPKPDANDTSDLEAPNSSSLTSSDGRGSAEIHGHGHGGDGHGHGGASAAIMVWVGILLDAIPESLVIGILVVSLGGPPLSFIIGVFLSNLPESMSSSGTMRVHGIPDLKIHLMWIGVVAVTTLGSTLGAILFPPGALDNPTTAYIVVGVEGIAAGAMLTMIAQTMLPEAFEQGGEIVGISCLLGFLAALSVRFLPLGGGGH